MTLLGFVVVVGDLRPQLDLADVDLLLVLAGGLLLLLLLVLVLRVVEQAGDRWFGVGSHLDQVEVGLLGAFQRLGVSTIPSCSPSAPIRRTLGTRIRSLIRVVSRSGGRRSNLRGTGTIEGEVELQEDEGWEGGTGRSAARGVWHAGDQVPGV